MAPPNIPDRWLDYTPVGQAIKGTRFIAFKVPLRSNVNRKVPLNLQLSCELLLKNVPSLGMVIDLTNTTRYYDPSVLEDQGIRYAKLMVPGHQIPPIKCVQEFKMLVNDFLQENANNSKLIGVHCTHGVNRTGYLISSFMISELKMSPQEAIKSVEEARGHEIERRNYLNHLMGVESVNLDPIKPHYNNNFRRSDNTSNRVARNNFNDFRHDRNRHSSSTDRNYNNYSRFKRERDRNQSRSSPSTYRSYKRHNSQSEWGRDPRDPLPNHYDNRYPYASRWNSRSNDDRQNERS